MIQPTSEFVVRGFWRLNKCKTFLASEICDFVSSFSEKGHATGVQLKNAKIKHFLLKSRIFGPKCWFFAFFELYTRSMSFF